MPPEMEAKTELKDPLKELELRDDDMEFEVENDEDFELYRNLAQRLREGYKPVSP